MKITLMAIFMVKEVSQYKLKTKCSETLNNMGRIRSNLGGRRLIVLSENNIVGVSTDDGCEQGRQSVASENCIFVPEHW